jgi:hypothetical protein
LPFSFISLFPPFPTPPAHTSHNYCYFILRAPMYRTCIFMCVGPFFCAGYAGIIVPHVTVL